jgi:outer membrane protein, adhesin transport system
MIGVGAALRRGLAIAAAVVAGGAAQAQSLSESVGLAVTTNPKVESMVHNREGVDAELRRARGLYLPQIDLHAAIGPEYTENVLTLGTNGEHMRSELEAVLTQKLYDGGATTAEVDRQLGRSKSAAYRIRENADSIGLDAVEAHLDVVRLRKILGDADENVRVHRSLLDRVKQRSAGGAGRGADVAQASTRLEQALAARDETRGLLQDAEAHYLIVVGRPPGTLEEAVLPEGALPPAIDASLLTAQSSNPAVKAREADIEAAEAGVDAADAKFDPLITLEVGGMHDRNVAGFPGRDDEARALVVLHWNLYAGGSDIANRESAYAQVAQAKTTRLEALRQAELDLRLAWSSYETAQRRLPNLTSAVAHDVEVRDAYDQQFQVNQRSLLDLLDSQNELFQAQSRLITVQEQVVFSGFRILAVQGTLLQSLNVQPPPEADYTQKTKRPQRPKKESY